MSISTLFLDQMISLSLSPFLSYINVGLKRLIKKQPEMCLQVLSEERFLHKASRNKLSWWSRLESHEALYTTPD